MSLFSHSVFRSSIVFSVLCFFLILPVSASRHKRVYHDGVLVDFHTASTGNSCSSNGTVNGTVNDNGDVHGQTNSNTECSSNLRAYYTVKIDDHEYVLTPRPSRKKAGAFFLTLGISAAFWRNSALYGVLPGTHIRVSSVGNGIFYVKVGKRVSEYSLVGAK